MTLSQWNIPRAGAGPSVRGAANDGLYWVERRPDGAFLCRGDGGRLALDFKGSVGIATTTNTALGPTTIDAARRAWLAAGLPPGELPKPSAEWRAGEALPEWLVRRMIWWAYARPINLPFESVVFDGMRDPPRYGEALGAAAAAAPAIICTPVTPRAPRDEAAPPPPPPPPAPPSPPPPPPPPPSPPGEGGGGGGGEGTPAGRPWWHYGAAALAVGVVGAAAYGARRVLEDAPRAPGRAGPPSVPHPSGREVRTREGALVTAETLRRQRDALLDAVSSGRDDTAKAYARDLARMHAAAREAGIPTGSADAAELLRDAREAIARERSQESQQAREVERAREEKPRNRNLAPKAIGEYRGLPRRIRRA